MVSTSLTRKTADTTHATADAALSRPVERIAGRLRSLIPRDWFSSDTAPVRDALLAGLGSSFAWVNALIAYARTQTRIATSTSFWLDLNAYDFFGVRFQRRTGEADASFSTRIRREIVRPRGTRQAISDAVTDLVGVAPTIVEPFNFADCGAYGDGSLAYGGTVATPAGLGGYDDPDGAYSDGGSSYGSPQDAALNGGGAGHWGSLSMPNQLFVTVRRQPGSFAEIGSDYGGYGDGSLAYGGGIDGTPAYPGFDDGDFGYGAPNGGYGFDAAATYSTGAGAYAGRTELVAIPDEEIYAAIARTAAAGVIAWTNITGP